MKKMIISICTIIIVMMACISPCWPLRAAEEGISPEAAKESLEGEQGQAQGDSLPEDSVDTVKRPDESVLYNELINPNSWVREYRKSRLNELPPPSFYPLEDAFSAETLGLLTPTIYSRKITLPLDKGGELILGRDQEEGSSMIYLDPHVVNEVDPEGTQYGFVLRSYMYMVYSRPDPDLPTSKVSMLDDFHNLEIYDLDNEPLAQYDDRAGKFAIFPNEEYEKIPSTNYFINDWTHEFIPCDGGVSFGPCYFHYEGESESLPAEIENSEYCVAFDVWIVVLRLSDGKILDSVGIWLEETEFNVFELRAVSLGADFKG